MIPHLPRCTKLTDPTRYACNCGADAQNATAAMLDAADPLATVPAEEQQRIDQIAWEEGQAKYLESGGSRSAAQGARDRTIAREVAAWHARKGPPCWCGAPATSVGSFGDDEPAPRCDTHAPAAPETLPGLAPLTPSDEAAILAFRAGQAVTRDLLATGAGPAARVTEDELREIEQGSDIEIAVRLAAEVRALQAEGDRLESMNNANVSLLTDQVLALRAELAARPAPADASEEARAIVLDSHLPNIVSFAAPLTPGARITSQELLVLHVVSLEAMLHGRPVFAALHEKDRQGRMLTMFVCDGDQRPWRTADASRSAPAERTFPRVALGSVAPGSLIEIASGEIGVKAKDRPRDGLPCDVLWIATGTIGEMHPVDTVSLRATPAELDAVITNINAVADTLASVDPIPES